MNYSVYLQRPSSNALTDRPKQLSVIIEVSGDRKFYSHISLFRLTKLKFPTYYGPFFLDNIDWSEKNRLMASFSEKQKEQIKKYSNSLHWYYDSEESLIDLLDEVKIQLIKVGLPTISFIKENGIKEFESFSIRHEMIKKSSPLYLMQLESISRFPIE